ncbi:hypothetical protein LSTR_LSTR011323 [Laodelphax striatellus]|uniref:Uncharacterized protein n=1 Tax=Laodelphax striatellus TaxID=195883 RepID=A0A482WGC6_LAOST|nr:hypothetical protein LSTR_LSTR011323 [Laodelphax striatellus]
MRAMEKGEDNSEEKKLKKDESNSLNNNGICRGARETNSSTSSHQIQNEFTATELREDWTDNEGIHLIPEYCNSNIQLQLFTDLQDKNEALLVFLDGVEITYLDSNGLEIEYSDINKENSQLE